MAANVICAGGGSPRRKVVAPAPCGWTGERFPQEHPNPDPRVRALYREHMMTAKPCPRCGGQVELIPEKAP